jgi:uncharacterized repeat protein (TIGR01451 family)
VVIGDTLLPGLAYISSAGTQGSYNPTAGAWTVGSLPLNGEALLTLTTRVNPATAGTVITNTAVISTGDNFPGNNIAEAAVEITHADLAVSKTAPRELALVGMPLTYTLSVTNYGPFAAPGVLTDTLPAGAVFSSASPGCIPGAGTVTCTVNLLAVNAVQVFTVAVTPPAATGPITNAINL